MATLPGGFDYLHSTTTATELPVFHPPPNGLLYLPGQLVDHSISIHVWSFRKSDLYKPSPVRLS